MNNKDKKIIEEQDKLLDHLIEYGGHQYIQDEMKKYEDLPEMDPSQEFDEKMHQMFQDAYKKESRREHLRLGKKIAVIAVAAIAVASAAAMNIKAVREPVLNFVFHKSNVENKTKINVKQNIIEFNFDYLPQNYKCTKKQYTNTNAHIIYKFDASNKTPIYINIQLNQTYSNYINQSSLNKYTELKIKNQTYYFLKANQNTLIFYKNNNIFSITSKYNLSTMVKIAQNIKQIKNPAK